ncbi:predicted protein [Uncinocarpus reesii 1704]|uniref:Uncharacterized protein n=1 Tax=Uncinocarpus reesii (strain UAMH 1704) TaxID=336963 RepID=C4JWS6_UNCRE|nr:uncharacterized protein UREG_06099 [Uncinocarpus reesii 1704]EEP81234.1 predicted protein [Uncinocarpus reesii 1704]
MARYQPDYLHNDRTRPEGGSPLTPYSSSQPPSFKTNVNRMKTKRWVNAKTYTYDGDDWGDSEDDDINDAYSDNQPSRSPPLPQAHLQSQPAVQPSRTGGQSPSTSSLAGHWDNPPARAGQLPVSDVHRPNPTSEPVPAREATT